MVASPPMLTLAPGAHQMIRVIRLGNTNAVATEDAYRLLVDELPQTTPQQQIGVHYVLRYSVPVFVEPANQPDAQAIAASLQWSLVSGTDGPALQIYNAGSVHAQISEVSLSDSTGAATTVNAGLLGYVLPGMTMRWPLKTVPEQLRSGIRLKAVINGKPVEQTLALGGLPR